MSAAAVRVLPVPVAISTSSLRRPRPIFTAQGVDALDLVVALDDAGSMGRWRVDAQRTGGGAALQVVLLEEGFDRPREGFALPFPEQHLVAVGRKM
jgi:hypothetical protein